MDQATHNKIVSFSRDPDPDLETPDDEEEDR
jgi:hypothetical protein